LKKGSPPLEKGDKRGILKSLSLQFEFVWDFNLLDLGIYFKPGVTFLYSQILLSRYPVYMTRQHFREYFQVYCEKFIMRTSPFGKGRMRGILIPLFIRRFRPRKPGWKNESLLPKPIVACYSFFGVVFPLFTPVHRDFYTPFTKRIEAKI